MSAEIELAETANALADALRILRILRRQNTADRIAAAAYAACADAEDHLEDVIMALADGRLEEVQT